MELKFKFLNLLIVEIIITVITVNGRNKTFL